MQDGATILIVDDNEANRDLLSRRIKQQGLNTVLAESGEQAFDCLRAHPIELILLDLMMPGMDGFEVLEILKKDTNFRDIPVIMISAANEVDNIVKGIELGADDYLPKPFNPVILKARVTASLQRKSYQDIERKVRENLGTYASQLEKKLHENILEIISGQHAAIFAMSKLAESKDPDTGAHLERIREYCKVIAEQLARTDTYKQQVDASFINAIYASSPLHDIGKVGVPDNILLKPDKLTDEEWVVMKTHTHLGADTLRAVDKAHPGNHFICMGIEIAESHHEKWDGSGYPFGHKAYDIPLSARILALADVYDALVSVRCYKAAFTHEQSKEILTKGSGQHFDPDVVSAFMAQEQEFVRIHQDFKD